MAIKKRRFLLFVTLLIIGLPPAGFVGDAYAAGQAYAASGNPSAQIKGTWHSARGTLTFNKNGTVIYKGKRYYYAVSSGGTIQLTAKDSSLTIPYQIAGGKLTLILDGRPTVYTRRR